MSPEIYKNVVSCTPNINIDFCKADVFSAGLAVLEAANLRRIRRIYGGPESRELIVEFLAQELIILKKRYPENNLLYSTVAKMLDINPKNRPTFLEILDKLPDFKLIKMHFIENGDSLPNEVDVQELFGFTTKREIAENNSHRESIYRNRNQSLDAYKNNVQNNKQLLPAERLQQIKGVLANNNDYRQRTH